MVRKFTTTALLAAFALCLVPARANGATIGFGGENGDSNSVSFFEDDDDFSLVKFVLTFDTVLDAFTVDVDAVAITQDELLAFGEGEENLLAGFPGHTCVPIAGGDSCVIFNVTDNSNGAGWDGDYLLQIVWNADTDGDFPNDPGNRIRILHNLGSSGDPDFETDITEFCMGEEDQDCGYGVSEVDPWIFGRDNNFQSFIVTQAAPVPEPATLALLGTGLAALAYRRRHRKAHPKRHDP